MRPARKWARRALLLLCLVGLAASGIWFFRYWQHNRQTQESVNKLREIVREAAQTPAESGEPDNGFAALQAENPDFAGWISIPGTAVDYPVMLPPADQPEYYLRRSFQKEYDINGIPFLDARCTLGPAATLSSTATICTAASCSTTSSPTGSRISGKNTPSSPLRP